MRMLSPKSPVVIIVPIIISLVALAYTIYTKEMDMKQDAIVRGESQLLLAEEALDKCTLEQETLRHMITQLREENWRLFRRLNHDIIEPSN